MALRQVYTSASKQVTGVSVQAGDLIVVAHSSGNSVDAVTVTDTAVGGTNEYRIPVVGKLFNPGGVSVYMLYAKAKATEVLTINVNTVNPNIPSIQVLVFGNVSAPIDSVLDGFAYAAQESSSSKAHAGASVTTTTPNSILVSFWAQDDASGSIFTSTEGFTKESELVAEPFAAIFDKTVSAQGTYSNAVSTTGNLYAGGWIAAFKLPSPFTPDPGIYLIGEPFVMVTDTPAIGTNSQVFPQASPVFAYTGATLGSSNPLLLVGGTFIYGSTVVVSSYNATRMLMMF